MIPKAYELKRFVARHRQRFWCADALAGLPTARVFDQDGSNLPQVQRGMKASKKGTITLANYQEVRIRHFHQTLDKYLSA